MSERGERDDGSPIGQEASEPVEDLFRKIDEAAALLGEILAQPSAEV